MATISLLKRVGLCPNVGKSQLIPSYSLNHLGHVWDSRSMIISIPESKCLKTQSLAERLLANPTVSLRLVASCIRLVNSHRGFPHAPLHYRKLQYFFHKMRLAKDWDDEVILPKEARIDVVWWAINGSFLLPPMNINIVSSSNYIYRCLSKRLGNSSLRWFISFRELVGIRGQVTHKLLQVVSYLEISGIADRTL